MNPLFQQMQGNSLIERFKRFQQTFKGNPQQQVQQLLNTGRISQSQYNQAVQMAQQLQKLIGIK